MNDNPVVDTTGSALSYTENDGAVAVDASVTITDVDNATLSSVTVSITAGFVAGEDALAFAGTARIEGAVSGNGQTVTLTAAAGQTPTLVEFAAAARLVKVTSMIRPG